MKKLLHSVFVLLFLTTSVYADHIIGGDITYTHLKDQKFQINVTMFRDCDECLIAGKGGGDNAKDCGGFDLYLYTVESSSCSRSLLEKVSLSFNSYSSILKLCDNARSKCSNSPNFSHGIEAHYYKGVVDFSKFSEYKNCGFELSIQTPMRKDDLTNVTGAEQYFFTYSEINPWIEHNSPQFKFEPNLLLNCGKQFSENVIENLNDGDSIEVSLVTPLKSRNTKLSYAADYSQTIPLKVYCGSDIDCKPDATSTPFKGFYLNKENGHVAFTPLKCDEKAVVAYEVKKWTRDKFGKYQQVSKVRRDIQLTVSSLSANNTPTFESGGLEELSACVGQTNMLSVYAKDIATMTPNGPLPLDTVHFDVLNAPDGLTYTEKVIPDAPYRMLELKWEPTNGQTGEIYYVVINLTDNACPLKATAVKTIRLVAKPAPQIETIVEKLECGYFVFMEKSGEGKAWKWNLQSLFSDWTGTQRSDTLKITKPGKYKFMGQATGPNGCVSSEDTTLTYMENDIIIDLIDPAVLNYSGCINDTIHLQAEIQTDEAFSARWIFKDGRPDEFFGKKISFLYNDLTPELELFVEVKRDNLVCNDNKAITLDLLPLPEIETWKFKELCYGSGDVNLMDGVTPSRGQWYYRHKSEPNWSVAENNSFSTTLWEHKHFDTEYLLQFRASDPETGCSNESEAKIAIKRLPLMELSDLDVCAKGNKFFLRVMVEKPYVYETGAYSWRGLDDLIDFRSDVDGDWILIPGGLLGKQRIVAENKTRFGCTYADTGTLNLLEDVKIELTDPGMICSTKEEINLSDLTKVNNRNGIWYSPDRPDWINNGYLSKDACGMIQVGYVIDKYGCFDQQGLTLDLRCSPDFTVDIPDTVCKNLDLVALTVTPAGGSWYGEGVRNKELDLSLVTGDVDLTYNYMDGICLFKTEHSLFVSESPEIDLGNYAQSICDNEKIEIEDIYFDNAKWKIETGPGNIYPDLENHRITYVPSDKEISSGLATISFVAEGKGLCKVLSKTVSVKINPRPVIAISAETFEGCSPFGLNLRSVSENENVYLSDVNFKWNFGDPESGARNTSDDRDPVHTYNLPGKYDVELIAIHDQGCEYRNTFEKLVTVWPSPVSKFLMEPDGLVSSLDPKVSFINMTSGDDLTFDWDFGDGKRSNVTDPTHHFPSDTGSYDVVLRAKNSYGCTNVYSDKVFVSPDIRILIPNAFTPNSKGPELTETFGVQGQNIKDLKVIIYNRWGAVMNEFHGINGSWDGTFKGTPCMSGVYFYEIEALSVTGHTYKYSGTLTLIR